MHTIALLLLGLLVEPETTTMVTSWYGDPFCGRATASGEIFNKEKFTAAHRELPFGTILELRNPTNGETISVEINDKGPFVQGRDLDVSRRTAEHLGFLNCGVVTLQVLSIKPPS